MKLNSLSRSAVITIGLERCIEIDYLSIFRKRTCILCLKLYASSWIALWALLNNWEVDGILGLLFQC